MKEKSNVNFNLSRQTHTGRDTQISMYSELIWGFSRLTWYCSSTPAQRRTQTPEQVRSNRQSAPLRRARETNGSSLACPQAAAMPHPCPQPPQRALRSAGARGTRCSTLRAWYRPSPWLHIKGLGRGLHCNMLHTASFQHLLLNSAENYHRVCLPRCWLPTRLTTGFISPRQDITWVSQALCSFYCSSLLLIHLITEIVMKNYRHVNYRRRITDNTATDNELPHPIRGVPEIASKTSWSQHGMGQLEVSCSCGWHGSHQAVF